MNKSIEWSPRSSRDYLNLLDYLQKEWGEQSIKKFNDRLQIVLNYLSERPEMYSASDKKKKVRRCVINKQTSLYYRIEKEKVELITLFDSRQNPSKKRI